MQAMYSTLSDPAKNDPWFMSLFWASYGDYTKSQEYINDIVDEFGVVKDYNDRIKKAKKDGSASSSTGCKYSSE
ncbi:hypothetical protein EBZ38_06750 [bacterium]|nr:hypothetical protein [bacterium]NDD83961.1 hypothetical protein [bacterium]